jgi:hypothetical protein
MRLLVAFTVLVCVACTLVAARLLANAQSPPVAYAAVVLGAGSVAMLCLALMIIWLMAA